jgi:hypothetical protein
VVGEGRSIRSGEDQRRGGAGESEAGSRGLEIVP